MARLVEVAREAIEPALFRVIGDDLLEKLKQRILSQRTEDETRDDETAAMVSDDRVVETTEEEMQFLTGTRTDPGTSSP